MCAGYLFQNHLELVARIGAVGEVLGEVRDAEEGRVGLDLDSAPVRAELKDAKPSVSAVAFPAAAYYLDIEHHLADFSAGVIGIHAISAAKGPVVWLALIGVLGGPAGVAAERQHDVWRLAEELVPDVLTSVCGAQLISYLGVRGALLLQQGVGDEDDSFIRILLAELQSPLKHLVARLELACDHHQLAPVLILYDVGCILDGDGPRPVGI